MTEPNEAKCLPKCRIASPEETIFRLKSWIHATGCPKAEAEKAHEPRVARKVLPGENLPDYMARTLTHGADPTTQTQGGGYGMLKDLAYDPDKQPTDFDRATKIALLWQEMGNGSLTGNLSRAYLAIREENERLKAELVEANHEVALQELNGAAIHEAREYLIEHLGEDTRAAFFDDCIHNAVALCLQARAALEAKEREIAELRRLYKQRCDEADHAYVRPGGEPR